MKTLEFTKTHGLGDGFMVVNAIEQDSDPLVAPLAQWVGRCRSVGFDQFLAVEKPSSDVVDFRYRIFDADDREVKQCGNGVRCSAYLVADKGLTSKAEILVETTKGIIVPKLLDNGLATVNMSKPRFMSSEIPFVPVRDETEDALTYTVLVGLESVPVNCVNMGSLHAVILADSAETTPVGHWGNAIELHEQFPERVNVGFMQIEDELSARLCVSERGVRETQAYGTGACVAVMVGVRSGLLKTGAPVCVTLPGGELLISWEEGGDMQIAGPTETVFEGELQCS